MPATFWGRVAYILERNGESFLRGAGNTMLIALAQEVWKTHPVDA